MKVTEQILPFQKIMYDIKKKIPPKSQLTLGIAFNLDVTPVKLTVKSI